MLHESFGGAGAVLAVDLNEVGSASYLSKFVAHEGIPLMNTVEIHGERLEPTGNFDYIPVSLEEYNSITYGDGGAGESPCAGGSQNVDWGFVIYSFGNLHNTAGR